ncbi:MAG: UvrD-helicase domain-containing protein [Bacilli bacterium]|nr:UvrD-helicase domain-containing protein [Bacilli bacterium]
MDNYFRNMFCGVDDSVVLDEEQINIIKNDDDNLMVIAGAGSGKTTTISAKVNYLIEKKGILDSEILVISFTNKAVRELADRINRDFKHNVNVLTFHKLGYEIIKDNCNPCPKIIKDSSMVIRDYIEKNIINDTCMLRKFLDFFFLYFDIGGSINMFKSHDEYYLYKNRHKYHTLKQKLDYVYNNLNDSLFTYSREERVIADYLFLNNICYKYREPYCKGYTPDFTVYQDGRRYYIEYFNMSRVNRFKFWKNIKKIRKIHRNNVLIEVYNDDIVETLDREFSRVGIRRDDKNINKIFDSLIFCSKDRDYLRFIDFSRNFISLFKSRNESILSCSCARDRLFNDFFYGLYDYYNSYLKRTNQIDFDDMINMATSIVLNGAKIRYKYIIIDEYQDISDNRFCLISAIKKCCGNKLMVVGDDWQCIYKFTSSNINLFTNFKKYVGNCTTLKITKTYRNSQQLIDIAGMFVQKNVFQIKKDLVSRKLLDYPITILWYKGNKMVKKLIEALNYLSLKYVSKNILILGRYTFDVDKIIDGNVLKFDNGRIVYKNNPSLSICFMTVHASKGLGFDNVILINALDDTLGFPSKIKNDPIVDGLLDDDEVMFAEERRLFYVGLTRTKNEVIILAPNSFASVFVREIKKYKHVKSCNILKYN